MQRGNTGGKGSSGCERKMEYGTWGAWCREGPCSVGESDSGENTRKRGWRAKEAQAWGVRKGRTVQAHTSKGAHSGRSCSGPSSGPCWSQSHGYCLAQLDTLCPWWRQSQTSCKGKGWGSGTRGGQEARDRRHWGRQAGGVRGVLEAACLPATMFLATTFPVAGEEELI